MELTIEGNPFPTKTVEVVDSEDAILRIQQAGSIIFADPEGLAHQKGKAVYAAALRRGITLVLRNEVTVGKKVFAVTLSLPPEGTTAKKRGRPRKV